MTDIQTQLGTHIYHLCFAHSEAEALQAEQGIRQSIRQGANPNLLTDIAREIAIPVELLVDPYGANPPNASRALKVLMEHDTLELSGAREALEGLTPLQHAAINAFDIPGSDDSMKILRLLANDPRVDLNEKFGPNTVLPEAEGMTILECLKTPEYDYPDYLVKAVEDAEKARVIAARSGQSPASVFPAAASREQGPLAR